MASTGLLTVFLAASARFLTAVCNLKTILFTCNGHDQIPVYQIEPFSFSTSWQVLGPFQSGTRESVWGADPLEHWGGFRSLTYDPEETFSSSLPTNASVGWKLVTADISSSSRGQVKVTLQLSFPEIDWGFLQSVYGWPALQYQAWARGFLEMNGKTNQTIALYTSGLLEFWVDNKHYFGGDYYRYRRAPVILRLSPGYHAIDLRLIRDVRALGAVGDPIIDVAIEAEARNDRLHVDESSLLISETIRGKLGGTVASINVQNNEVEWTEIVSISSPDAPQHDLFLEKPLHLSSYQARPLIFNVILGQLSESRFSVEILYRVMDKDRKLLKTRPFDIYLTEKQWLDTQKITFLHPAKVVSYAILRPPPLDCTMLNGQSSLPIIICLHGAGLEADSAQVRSMLDAAHGTCAWVLFPSGVTSWSGDDWHIWGTADVKAAIAAISNWIENIGWHGPGVLLRDWIVIGHSNGGQGTWFFSTHFPDNVVAAAPVSGYSSIENYVPYSMWQNCEPLLSSMLQKARISFKHELLLGNIAGIPLLQQHGSSDDNVPVFNSRLMRELLEQTGWLSEYHELPGGGHWSADVMMTPWLLDFYNKSAVSPNHPDMPLEFTVTIPSSGYMESKCGIFVDQLRSPDINGQIKVTRNLEQGLWRLQTQNIYRFHLSTGSSRIGLPAALMVDDMQETFEVDASTCETTWYLKDTSGTWSVSADISWRNISQRYGRQLGAMDAIMSAEGTFLIDMCSIGIEHVALQISRNLFQYSGADSQLSRECDPARRTFSLSGRSVSVLGNVITLAIGDDLPSSKYTGFPIRSDRGRLVFSRQPISNSFVFEAETILSPNGKMCRHKYEKEAGLGALFLRPLQDERLELVVWGADAAGLEQAARLVPTLTGVGQPDFLVMSKSCRWKGHAGLYAAGYFDKSWQISTGSYFHGDAEC